MTEQEAKEWLECIEFEAVPHTQKALIIAIEALEEIQQYRAIGTVEEITKINDFFSTQTAKILAKLQEYERTGLTPQEIMDGKLLSGWIPVEERLPDESDYYCVTTENTETDIRIEQTIWFAHKDDYDIEESEWRELADYEKVIAWRKSDPYNLGN